MTNAVPSQYLNPRFLSDHRPRPHVRPVSAPCPQLCAYTQTDGASASAASGVCTSNAPGSQVLGLDQMTGIFMVQIVGVILAVGIKCGGAIFRRLREDHFPRLQLYYELRKERREESLLGFHHAPGTGPVGLLAPVRNATGRHAVRGGFGAMSSLGLSSATLNGGYGRESLRGMSVRALNVQGVVNNLTKGAVVTGAAAAGSLAAAIGGGGEDAHSRRRSLNPGVSFREDLAADLSRADGLLAESPGAHPVVREAEDEAFPLRFAADSQLPRGSCS